MANSKANSWLEVRIYISCENLTRHALVVGAKKRQITWRRSHFPLNFSFLLGQPCSIHYNPRTLPTCWSIRGVCPAGKPPDIRILKQTYMVRSVIIIMGHPVAELHRTWSAYYQDTKDIHIIPVESWNSLINWLISLCLRSGCRASGTYLGNKFIT